MQNTNTAVDKPCCTPEELFAAMKAAKSSPADTADADTTPAASGDSAFCHDGERQSFPVNVLPPVLADFITHTARVMDVDPSQVASPVLAVVSAAVGNTRRLRLRSKYLVPAVLWTVTVAESGEGKSPAFHAAMEPLVDEQRRHHNTHAAAFGQYDDARRAWLASPKASRGDEPTPPRPMPDVYVSDATAEAIAAVLADNPRGVLCAVDEFAGLVKSFNAYKSGGADREAYLSFYDAKAAKVNRKTGERRQTFVPAAFVAITGTIQPAVLGRLLTRDDAIGSGFAARLLLTMPPRRPRAWIDDDVPEDVADAYAGLITTLRALPLADEPMLVRPSAAAYAAFKRLWNQSEAEKMNAADPAVRFMLPKYRDAAARLALLLHTCRVAAGVPGVVAERLDVADMDAGVALARWYMSEARRVYAMLGSGHATHARPPLTLLEWIESQPGQSATRRDVMRGSLGRQYPTAGAAARALDELAKAGYGTWQHPKPGTKGGAPVAVFVLNQPTAVDTIATRDVLAGVVSASKVSASNAERPPAA